MPRSIDNAKLHPIVGDLSTAGLGIYREEINKPFGNTGIKAILYAFGDHFAIWRGDRDTFILAAIKERCDLQSDRNGIFTQLRYGEGEGIGTINIFSMKLLFKIASCAEHAYGKTAYKTCQGDQYDG